MTICSMAATSVCVFPVPENHTYIFVKAFEYYMLKAYLEDHKEGMAMDNSLCIQYWRLLHVVHSSNWLTRQS